MVSFDISSDFINTKFHFINVEAVKNIPEFLMTSSHSLGHGAYHATLNTPSSFLDNFFRQFFPIFSFDISSDFINTKFHFLNSKGVKKIPMFLKPSSHLLGHEAYLATLNSPTSSFLDKFFRQFSSMFSFNTSLDFINTKLNFLYARVAKKFQSF